MRNHLTDVGDYRLINASGACVRKVGGTALRRVKVGFGAGIGKAASFLVT